MLGNVWPFVRDCGRIGITDQKIITIFQTFCCQSLVWNNLLVLKVYMAYELSNLDHPTVFYFLLSYFIYVLIK